MSSPMITSPVTTTSNRARKKKHKNNKLIQASAQSNVSDLADTWKSSAQQQAYSSKLLHALRQVPLGVNSTPSRSRAVREAADRALAFTARGRTRWSRAILSARLRLKFMKNKRVVAKPRHHPRLPASGRARKPRVGILRLKSRNNNNNNLPAVQRKVRVLGRLVPGCRKEALPVILEEATDYIAALQMQIRAMNALAELLSGSSSQTQLVEHGSSS